MQRLLGKVPARVLRNIVFRHLGAERRDVILGPGVGLDNAVLRVGRGSMVVSADPVTGAEKRLGTVAVHVSANDVAVSGVPPAWFSSVLLLPPRIGEARIRRICRQIHDACRSLRVAVVGGHTEFTDAVSRPVAVGFMAGAARRRPIESSGARPGDVILLTRGAGIEGTAILAEDLASYLSERLDAALLRRARRCAEELSVVRQALAAAQTGGVTAMHDPTEGGVAGAVHEMADASGNGFLLRGERVLVREETRALCRVLRVNPLALISSGSLLVACRKRSSAELLEALRETGVWADEVGVFTPDPRQRVIETKEGRRALRRPLADELWSALERGRGYEKR